MTTRRDQAEHMAITDPYWRAYLDGLDDRHRIRDNTRDADHAEANRLLQARLDRVADLRARREREQITEYLTPDQARKYPGGTADL